MFVYFVRCLDTAFVKIGKASDVEYRISKMQTGCPYELSLMLKIKCESDDNATKIEKELHKAFLFHKFRGEWFQISGNDFRKTLANIKMDGVEVEVCEFKRKFITPKTIRKAKKRAKHGRS